MTFRSITWYLISLAIQCVLTAALAIFLHKLMFTHWLHVDFCPRSEYQSDCRTPTAKPYQDGGVE